MDHHHLPGAGHQGLRAQLSATVAAAAGPYGYTVSLGGSIALTAHHLGGATYGGAMLLMAGAVVAFLILELIAQGSFAPSHPEHDFPPTVWGNAHIPAAGAAISSVWGLIHVVDEPVAWLVVGFTATSVYFMVSTLQRIAIAALRRRASAE